jgi:hypothetical protein
MLVHCFWLLDSNLGLNSEFVCSLFGLEKVLDLKKEKEKKEKPKPPQQPGLLPLAAQCGPVARRSFAPPADAAMRGRLVSIPFPAPPPLPTRARTRVRLGVRAAALGPRVCAPRCLYLSAPPSPCRAASSEP